MINFRALLSLVALIVATVSPSFAQQAPPAQLSPVSLNDVIATVEKSFATAEENRYADGRLFLYDLVADFTQRSVLAGKEQKELIADGEFMLKNADYKLREPLKFRFEYFRPTRHLMVTDGTSLWTYLPANRQVILSNMTAFLDPQFSDPTKNRGFNFLQGLPRISKDFLITFSTQRRDAEGNYILELAPRQAMETVAKLFIVVDKDSVTRYVQYNRRQIVNPLYKNNRAGDNPRQAFPILSTTVIDHRGNATTIEFSNIKPNVGLNDLLFVFDIPADVETVRPPGSTGRLP